MEALTFKVPPDYTDPARTKHSAFASGSKKILPYVSESPENTRAATLVGTVAQGIDYSQGGKAPLEADRFTKIKENLSKIQAEGISGWAALEVLMQSIIVFQVYAILYEAIKNVPIKDYLPFNELLFPLANLYLIPEGFLEDIEAWQNARGTDKKKDVAIKVAGTFASCLLYATQIVVFLSATKLAVSLQTVLNLVIYASFFFGLFKSEYDSEASQRERDNTPPQFILRV